MLDVKNDPAAMAFSARVAELRFPLIALIVVYHSFVALEFKPHSIMWGLFSVLVVMFFIFSGYFLTWRLEDHESLRYGDMMMKKVKSLLIPYLLWNLLLFVPHYLLEARGAGWQFPSLLPALGDAFGITDHFPVVVPLWFLRNLFLCFLISPVLLWLARLPGMIFLAIPLLLVEYYFWEGNPMLGPAMFFFGMVLGLKKYDLRWLDRIFWIAVPVAIAVLTVIYLMNWNNCCVSAKIIVYILPPVIGLFLMCRLGLILEKCSADGWLKKSLVWCAVASTLVFCIHSPMLSIAARVTRRFCINLPVLCLVAIVQAVAVILICCVANHIGKKLFPKLTDIVTGGRFG